MKNLVFLVCLLGVFLFTGCTQNIPMKSSINEFVLMNIKTSSQKGVKFNYSSNIYGTTLPLYGKDKKPFNTGGMTYVCDENNTLNSMISEYLQNKFLQIDDNASLGIDIKMDDFYVEYYCTDSGGTQALQAFASGLSGSPMNLTYMCTSKVALLITIYKDGNKINKRLTASSDVMTSGNQTTEVLGNSINQVNNKVLMLLNAFLAENEL